MKQLMMSDWELQMRVKQYRSDPTIEMFRKVIAKTIAIARPFMKINITNPLDSQFDIDEKSKDAINYWKQKLDEYVLSNYSDIISNT